MPGRTKTVAIEVEGLPDLRKALLTFETKVATKATNSATLAGAKVIAKAIRANTPVMSKPNKFTGKLDPRRSVGAMKRNVTQTRRTRGVQIASLYAAGIESGAVPETNAQGRVESRTKSGRVRSRKLTKREQRGEDPFYKKFVERGYRATGSRRGGSGQKIAGRFFMENAFNASDKLAIEAMRKKLESNIARLRVKK